jgi:amino acid adenylation domain-containing protein
VSGGVRLPDYLRRQAERRPEAMALASKGETMSYGALEERSSQIARLLRATGTHPGDRVALLSPKTLPALAAMLGVYKADAILVPLDDASPAARLERILRSSECRCVIGGGTGERLGELAAANVLPLDTRLGWLGEARELARHGLAPTFDRRDIEGASAAPVAARPRANDAAHILYTSGSTGEPKGVVVRHASVVHFVDWAVAHFGMAEDDRVSSHSPLPFDLSTFDIFGALAAGASLHLVPPELNLLPHRLAEWMRGERLTQWFSVPSLLTYMVKFDVLRPGDFPELRRLLWCGEIFPTAALRYWMERLPHVAFTNLYGPTEATIASTFYDMPAPPPDDAAPVPIGRAIPGEELFVLDDDLAPLPAGVAGGLYIRGAGLSPGYWRDAERTRAAFLPNPFGPDAGDRIYRTGDLAYTGADGLLYLLGRADSQIKCRGYRIELGEIETAVLGSGLVREAVVTAVASPGFEGLAICCAYAPNGDGITHLDLKRRLGELLPPYMLPVRFLALPSLPRNGNGKLDRRRVKEEFEGGFSHLAAASAAAPTHATASREKTEVRQ